MKKLTKKKISKVFSKILFLIFIFFLPTQFGKHFFPSFSYINGVRVDYLAPTIYLTDILVFLLFIFNIKEVVNFFKNKKLLFIIVIFLINIFFAKNQLLGLYRFIKIIEFLIIYSLSSFIFNFLKEKIVLILFLLTGLFQLILSLIQLTFKQSAQGVFYFLGERLINLSTPGVAKGVLNGIEFLRPYGTFSHPNSLGGFFLLLYFFVLIYRKFNKYFFLKYFNLLIFSILIFISFSKTAIFTYLFINTIYWVSNNKIKCFFCKITKIIIPFLTSLIFLQVITDPLTINKRVELIKNSLKIISTHLLLGVGLGNYLIAQTSFSSKYFLFFNQPVHNIFLLLVAEMGIILTIIIFFQIFRSWKSFLIKKYWPIILSVVLTGFFDHYWLTLQQNFFLLAVIYGSVSKAFFIDKLSSKS